MVAARRRAAGQCDRYDGGSDGGGDSGGGRSDWNADRGPHQYAAVSRQPVIRVAPTKSLPNTVAGITETFSPVCGADTM